MLIISCLPRTSGGWAIGPCLRPVLGACMFSACSPRATRVSSPYSGFPPHSRDMHCRPDRGVYADLRFLWT